MAGAFTHRIGVLSDGGGGGPPGGGFGSHLAWMLEIDENNGHSTTQVDSLVFKDSGGNVIPTTGGTAFSGGSGSDDPSGPAANAFDSNNSTVWNRSSATNTKIGYIFSSAVEVATVDIIIAGASATRAPKIARIRSSDDTTTGLDGTYTTALHIWETSWATSGTVTRSWPQDFALGTLFKELWFTVGPNDNGNRFPALNELEYRATVGGADFSSTGFHRLNFPGSNEGFAFDDNNSSVLFFDTLQVPWPGSLITAFPTPVALAQIQMHSNNDNSRIPRDIKVVGKWLDSTGTIQSADLITQTGISGTIPFTQTYNV